MITSFQHKGIELFFRTGSMKGIQPSHAKKLRNIIGRLDASICPEDMNMLEFKLHPLKGDLNLHWAVSVNGNWRVTFRFVGSDAELVDYQDYH